MLASPALLRLAASFVLSLLIAGCATPEDPARIELRARLKQTAVLSEQELGRMLNEVDRSIGDKVVRFTQEAVPGELSAGELSAGELSKDQREVVFGMLTNHNGVYDEGLSTSGDAAVRVFNAPGLSLHAEYSAARRLFVDLETFLPRRFEFRYEFPGMGDYSLELAVDP